MIHRIALADAATICGVAPGTIRRWVHDGRLQRHWNGFDYDDLIAARDSRSADALCVRAGILEKDRPRVMLDAR